MTSESARPRLVATDTVVLVTTLAIAVSPFADVYSGRGWMVAVLAGILLGVGITLLARAARWGAVVTALVTVLGYLVIGSAVAVPDDAASGFLPSPAAGRALLTGIVQSWRATLTLPVPIGSAGDLIVPFVIALAGALVATVFLWRTRWPGGGALAVGGVFVAAAAFGTRNADLPLVRGLVLVLIVLLWQRWRSQRHLSTSWVRRVSLSLAVVAVAGFAGWGMSSALGHSGTREVLRDHIDPPLAELSFKSPLARFRDYYKNHKNDVLFTFDNLPPGSARIRLATMDTLDGIVWNVATKDLVTGTSPFRTAPGSSSAGAISVTVGEYDGPWIPTVGSATGVDLEHDAGGRGRELLLNTATGSVVEYGNARKGDVFRIDWVPRPERTNDVVTADVDPTVVVQPLDFGSIENLDTLTQKWVGEAGATTAYERAVALEQGFHEKGYFNDGLDPVAFGYSPSGHGAKRLADLVADPLRMVGNQEQYASAMAYAAQRLGLPARVVMGFKDVRPNGTVIGDDIDAWVEIPFVGVGWVPFEPTPPEDRTPPPQEQDPKPIPQPYVVQPPVLPQDPADLQGVPPEGEGRGLASRIWEFILMLLRWLWLVVKIVLVLAPLWLIVLVKRARRRRRRRAADPVDRLSAGWREMTDQARDLGLRVPQGGTRYESGVLLASRFPTCDSYTLAASADQHVFGAGVPGDDEVTAYWADVDTAIVRMRRSVPWWRRVLALLSPASIPWREMASTTRTRAMSTFRRVRLPWGSASHPEPTDGDR